MNSGVVAAALVGLVLAGSPQQQPPRHDPNVADGTNQVNPTKAFRPPTERRSDETVACGDFAFTASEASFVRVNGARVYSTHLIVRNNGTSTINAGQLCLIDESGNEFLALSQASGGGFDFYSANGEWLNPGETLNKRAAFAVSEPDSKSKALWLRVPGKPKFGKPQDVPFAYIRVNPPREKVPAQQQAHSTPIPPAVASTSANTLSPDDAVKSYKPYEQNPDDVKVIMASYVTTQFASCKIEPARWTEPAPGEYVVTFYVKVGAIRDPDVLDDRLLRMLKKYEFGTLEIAWLYIRKSGQVRPSNDVAMDAKSLYEKLYRGLTGTQLFWR